MFVRISIQANVVSLTTPKSKILLLCYRIHNNASCPTSSSKQTSIHPHFRSPYPASKSHPLSSHLRAPLAPSPIQATGLFIESFAATQNLVHGPQLNLLLKRVARKMVFFYADTLNDKSNLFLPWPQLTRQVDHEMGPKATTYVCLCPKAP